MKILRSHTGLPCGVVTKITNGQYPSKYRLKDLEDIFSRSKKIKELKDGLYVVKSEIIKKPGKDTFKITDIETRG